MSFPPVSFKTFSCFSNWTFFKLASLSFFSYSKMSAFALFNLFWYCFFEEVCFLIGVTSGLSLFIGLRALGLGGFLITSWTISNFCLTFWYCYCIFWVGFLYLFLKFFAVIYFCFIFSNWSSRIWISGKSYTFFLSTVLQRAAHICPSFQVSPSVRKAIFYCDWISEFSVGRQ